MARRTRMTRMRRAAELYYEQHLSQREISTILGCSFATVSRLLAEAREQRIVEIRVAHPVETAPELAVELRDAFGLRDALVVRGENNRKQGFRDVVRTAAEFLPAIIEDGVKVGVTWGETLSAVLHSMEPLSLKNVEVVQIAGSVDPETPGESGPGSAIRLAGILGARCRLIPAPAIVDSARTRELFLGQPQIRSALKRAASPDVVIQGVGTLASGMSSLRRASFISREEREAAIAAGAVGHVAARIIGIYGEEVGDFSDRVIGIPLADIRKAGWSVGIAASVEKAAAVLGGLRGGFYNCLIGDEALVNEVLRLSRGAPPGKMEAA